MIATIPESGPLEDEFFEVQSSIEDIISKLPPPPPSVASNITSRGAVDSPALDFDVSEREGGPTSLVERVEDGLRQWRGTLHRLPELRKSVLSRMPGSIGELIMDEQTIKMLAERAPQIAQGADMRPWVWEGKFSDEVRWVISKVMDQNTSDGNGYHTDDATPRLGNSARFTKSDSGLNRTYHQQETVGELQNKIRELQSILDAKVSESRSRELEVEALRQDLMSGTHMYKRLHADHEQLKAEHVQLLNRDKQLQKEKKVLKQGWLRECESSARLRIQHSIELEKERRKSSELRQSLHLTEEEVRLLVNEDRHSL